jgi:hypothetical protein
MSRLDVENPLAAPEDAASEYLQSPAYRQTHPLTRSPCEMCRFLFMMRSGVQPLIPRTGEGSRAGGRAALRG